MAATQQKPTTAAAPAAAPSPTLSLVSRLGHRFGVDPNKLLETLKATAFRTGSPDRPPSTEELMALLVIADEHGLNPFTRELYAFLDKKTNAVVPIVSVDGWIRIINAQPTLRSISFTWSDDTVDHSPAKGGKTFTCHAWMECEIVRSDRDKPIVIREYFAEVVRRMDFATPWDTHPNRMHRHKVLIQAGRVAFGFGGIFDPDEASRLIEGESVRMPEANAAAAGLNAALTHQPIEGVPTVVQGERVTVDAQKRADEAEAAARAKRNAEPPISYAQIADKLRTADTPEAFAEAVDLIRHIADPTQQQELQLLADQIESGQA
jgi:hypothetical protein